MLTDATSSSGVGSAAVVDTALDTTRTVPARTWGSAVSDTLHDAPGANDPVRTQVTTCPLGSADAVVQTQPVPDARLNVRPAGRVTLIVTGVVTGVVPVLRTVAVKLPDSPVWNVDAVSLRPRSIPAGGGVTAFTVRVNDVVTTTPKASVAVTATVAVPVTVVEPEITPAADSVSPVGRPVADHVTVGTPPDDASVVEYAAPEVAAGSDAVVMASAAWTVSAIVADAAPRLLLAVTFTESADAETSAALGVPVILPEVESIDAHAGSPVADHVIAPLPPVAEGATTRAEPTSAVTAEGAVIATDG